MLEINNKSGHEIDRNLLKKVFLEFCDEYQKQGFSASLALVPEEEMRFLNKNTRGKDEVTDILSFESAETDFSSDSDKEFFGEIIICMDKIKEQSVLYGHTFQQEFIFIFIHGLLHLAGFEDLSEEGRIEMKKRGEEFMRKIEI